MDKIPFAENLAQYLPGSYNNNLALLNEIQMQAMHEDNRRWRLAEQRYQERKDAANEAELTKATPPHQPPERKAQIAIALSVKCGKVRLTNQ